MRQTRGMIEGTFPIAGSTGYLGRVVPWGTRLVPRQIKVRKGCLAWAAVRDWQNDTRADTSTQGALDGFARLAEATDSEILSFAQLWGPLVLCKEHNLHACHRPIQTAIRTGLRCEPRRLATREYIEPLDSWRGYAKRALVLLRLAAELRTGGPGSLEDWRVLVGDNTTSRSGYGATDPPERWDVRFDERGLTPESNPWPLIAMEVNWWLNQSCAKPACLAQGKEVAIKIGGDPFPFFDDFLFSLLATQLLVAVTGAEGLIACSQCKTPYSRRRPIRPGEKNYCPSCRRAGVPQRNASSKYYWSNHEEIAQRRKNASARKVKR
jgi:hypothetical protein